MLTALRTHLRAYLGTDLIPQMEDRMTTFLTLLQGLADQQTEASAAQQASFLNLHNAITRLEQSVTELQTAVSNGDVSDDVQAAAASISESLATMKKAADTADDGFEPVEEPTEPTDPGAEVPPVDNGGDVPAEPVDPDAPTENTRRGR